MKQVTSSISKSGRDCVQLYFDPEGKESVGDRMVEEGVHVARAEDQEIGTGMGHSARDEHGMELEVESLSTGDCVVTDGNHGSRGNHGGNHGSRRNPKGSLMAKVTTALQLLQ